MVGDVYMNNIGPSLADKWNKARLNISALAPNVDDYLIGRPEHGYVNYVWNPRKYVRKERHANPWESSEPTAMALTLGPTDATTPAWHTPTSSRTAATW